MSSIADKLRKVLQFKESVKTVLADKGIQINEGESLTNYLEKIETMETPESSTPIATPGTLSGLIVWLDGEVNSRAGVRDESINGMQNLMYAPYTSKTTTTGCREVLNGTPTFTEKTCKLGGTMFVPCYEQDKVSFEFVGNFDTNNFNNVISQQLFTNSINAGGYQIMMTPGELHYQLFNKSNQLVKHYYYPIPVQAGKTYYIAVTDSFTATSATEFYIDGQRVQPVIVADSTGGVCTQTVTNIGIMGVHHTNAVSVYPVTANGAGCFYGEYTNINVYRLWNRVLTAEEVKKHYESDKRRVS